MVFEALQVIAREVVNSNKAISRLHTQKAHMMDMEMALKHQLGANHVHSSRKAVCGIICLEFRVDDHLSVCCSHGQGGWDNQQEC